MADNTISLSDTPQQSPITLEDPTAVTSNLSTDSTEYRSTNAHFGLTNQTFFTKDDWSKAIKNGQEDVLRSTAASKVNTGRIETAKQLIDTYGDQLPDGVLQNALKYQDPKTVVEEHYAKTYMNFLNWPTDPKNNAPFGIQDGWAYITQKENQKEWDWLKNAGSMALAKRNYALTVAQNDNQETTWKDHVNTIVPDLFTAGLFGEVQMRQNTAGTPWYAGLGMGSQLKAQSDALNDITDFDEWRKEFDRVHQLLPQAYKGQWVQDMLYKSTGSEIADNLATGLNAAFAGKGASVLGRNILSPAAREAAANRAFANTRFNVTVTNTQSRLQNIINAVSDMAMDRPQGISPRVSAPAQAGNIPESAVNKVAIDAINELYPNNNPLGAFINRIQAIYDTDGSLAASHPGSLGNEAANRLKDMYSTYKDDFVNTIYNNLLQRVDRTPTAELTDQLHKIQKGLADLFRGPDNQVVNVSRGLWLPGLNNRMYNVAIGTNDADLFKSLEEAIAVARRNGWAVKGDYAVGPEERVSIAKKENLIQGLISSARKAETFEGATNAYAKAQKLQKELDAIPRHETGVTVEKQFRSGQQYASPIGPTRPTKPAGALKSPEATPVAPSGKPSPEPSVVSVIPGLEKSPGDVPYGSAFTAHVKAQRKAVEDYVNNLPKGEYQLIDKDGNPAGKLRTQSGSVGSRKIHHIVSEDGTASEFDPSSFMWQHVTDSEGNSKWQPGLRIQTNKSSSVAPTMEDRLSQALGGEDSLANFKKMQQETAREAREAVASRKAAAEQNTRQAELEEKSMQMFGKKYDDLDFNEWARVTEEWPPRPDQLKPAPNSTGNKPLFRSVGGRFIKNTEAGPTKEEWNQLTKYLDELKKEGKDTPTTIKEIMEKFWGLPSEVITQQGNGYYILHTVFLPEGASFVRDGLLTSNYGKLSKEQFRNKLALGQVSTGVPPDWANGWVAALTNMGGISAPSEVMSIAENLNRNIATHGPAVLLGLTKRSLKPIAEMPKKYWNDFNRLLRYTQSAFNEDTRTPGIWFNTLGDVDDWYQRNIGRQLTEQEARAYFAYKAIVLNDLNFRNLSVMTRKLALGARQHAVRYTDEYGQKTITDYFEGVRLDRLPENGWALYTNSADPSKSKYGAIGRILQNNPELVQDIESGKAQIIHIMDPKSKPMDAIRKGAVPDYVISYNTEEKPLGYNHVNRLGGGHLVPKWGWFAKQADVDTTTIDGGLQSRYNGDKTLLSFKSRAQAQEAIEYLEPVRKLLSDFVRAHPYDMLRDIERWENEGGAIGRGALLDEASVLAQKTGIPFSKLLDMWVGPKAAFNVHEPIIAVPKGQRIINLGEESVALKTRYRHSIKGSDLNQRELIDGTKDGSLLGQVMTEFTQERDAEGLFTMRFKGTESNPWFAYEPADLVDPITAIERAQKNIVNSMYMYDLKQYTMEHWLEQAKDYLRIDNINELRNNPMKWFYNPVWKEGFGETDPQIYWHLEGNRKNAIDFIGLKTKYDTSLTRIGQALFDGIYKNTHYEIDKLLNIWDARTIGNFLKGCAFYGYISGIKSFYTQAATMSYIWAVGGAEHAMKATAAMTAYGYWKVNGSEEILRGLDNAMARHFDWRPGRFTEAVRMLEGTGFGHVGQEHAFRQGEASIGLQGLSDINPWMVGTKTTMRYGKAALDMSSIPFELGASTTRISGFFTAYLEQLEKAPGGIVDRQLQSAILGRASLLDINMSRAHNTALQNMTLPSIPMQFGSYDIRMAQMMWGKNLSVEEKQRLFATSAMLYGMRGGGIALFGFPLADATMKMFNDAGYVPGEDTTLDIAINGWPSWMFAMLSGFANSEGKKTWIDASSWGNRGVSSLERFFDKNKTLAESLAGATGGIFESLWDNTWGLRRALVDYGKPDGYKATSADWLQLFDVMEATKEFHQGWLALHTGRMLTDKGTYVTDSSAVETFLRTFMGLKTIDVSDTYSKEKLIQDYSEEERKMGRHITQELMRYSIDDRDNNRTSADQHWHNASGLLLAFIPEDKRKQVFEGALRNMNESLADRINQKLNIDYKNDIEKFLKLKKGM